MEVEINVGCVFNDDQQCWEGEEIFEYGLLEQCCCIMSYYEFDDGEYEQMVQLEDFVVLLMDLWYI